MNVFMYILLGLLLVCAISVTFSKNLLNSILIFMAYSLVMSIIWILLESPDLAITEAAVGAGVTSILFFITLKKIHGVLNNPEDDLDGEDDSDDSDEDEAAESAEATAVQVATDEDATTENVDTAIANDDAATAGNDGVGGTAEKEGGR